MVQISKISFTKVNILSKQDGGILCDRGKQFKYRFMLLWLARNATFTRSNECQFRIRFSMTPGTKKSLKDGQGDAIYYKMLCTLYVLQHEKKLMFPQYRHEL